MVQIQHRSLLKNVSTLEVWGLQVSSLAAFAASDKKLLWPRSHRTSHSTGENVFHTAIPSRDLNCFAGALGKDLWKKRTINISFSHGKLYSSMQLCIWETISLSRSFPFILTFCILPVRCLLCSFLRGLRMLYCGIQPDRRAAAFSSCSSFLK